MKLLDIDFGPVLDASGARGFFGDGYPYHRTFRSIGLDFTGSTFVSKTATLTRKTGFLLYHPDGVTPLETHPDCVIVRFRKGIVLNAVGLGNPGINALLAAGRWQELDKPFFISVMPVLGEREWRLQEFVAMMRAIRARRREFKAPFGLQLNLSCSNVGLEIGQLVDEAVELLSVAAHYLPGVPLMPKFSVETPLEALLPIARSEHCHALCVSNALRWGSMYDRISWRELFGSDESPLKLYGGGAMSGAPLLPLVTDWVKKARCLGIAKPINAGGGILDFDDARTLFKAGADSVSLGSIAILRCWRVRKTIAAIQKIFG